MSRSTSNRRLSVTTLAGVEQQGRGFLGGGGLTLGLQDALSCGSQTVQGTHLLPFVRPLVHQGQNPGVGSALFGQEGSSGACSSSFSGVLQLIVCGDEGLRFLEAGHRLFASESEGTQDILQNGDSPGCSSLGSARRLDGVSRLEGVSYLEVPIHPDGRKYLRLIAFGQVYQFKALCFGLFTAPQVFTRVMAPVSTFLHRAGIRIRRYLDD